MGGRCLTKHANLHLVFSSSTSWILSPRHVVVVVGTLVVLATALLTRFSRKWMVSAARSRSTSWVPRTGQISSTLQSLVQDDSTNSSIFHFPTSHPGHPSSMLCCASRLWILRSTVSTLRRS